MCIAHGLHKDLVRDLWFGTGPNWTLHGLTGQVYLVAWFSLLGLLVELAYVSTNLLINLGTLGPWPDQVINLMK